MATKKGLFIEIGADDTKLQRALKNSANSVHKFGRTLGASVKSVAKWATVITGASAVVAAFLKKLSFDSIDATAKFADRIGISTEALTELHHVAQATGQETGNFNTALQRMARRIEEAGDGAGVAAPALKSLGIDIAEIGKQTPDQQLNTLADAFAGVTSESERLRLAVQIFDTEGAGMAVTLRDGSGAIADLREEAQRLGLSLSRVDAAKVESANDAVARAFSTFQSFGRNIAAKFAPLIEWLADKFTELSLTTGGIGPTAEKSFDMFYKAGGFVADFLEGMIKTLQTVIGLVTRIGSVAAGAASAFISHFKGAFDFIFDGFRFMVEQINRIPGINIDAPTIDAEGFATSLSTASEVMGAVAEDMADKVENSVSGSMRAAFESTVTEIMDGAEKAGQAFVDAQKEARAAGSEVAKGLTEDQKAELAEQLLAISDRFESEKALLERKLAEEQELLKAAFDNKLVGEEERNALELQLKAEHEGELTRIAQEAADARDAIAQAESDHRLAISQGTFGKLAGLMQSGSKKMFEVGKAAALGNAAVTSYESAIRARNIGNATMIPGMGAAFMAADLAASAVQIQKLSSTQYGQKSRPGGGGGGGAVSGGGAAEAPRQSTIVEIVGSESSTFSRGQVESLIGQINDAVGDGVQLAGA